MKKIVKTCICAVMAVALASVSFMQGAAAHAAEWTETAVCKEDTNIWKQEKTEKKPGAITEPHYRPVSIKIMTNGKEMKSGKYLLNNETRAPGARGEEAVIRKSKSESENTAGTAASSQETGDMNQPLLFAGLALAAGAVLAVVVKKRKK